MFQPSSMITDFMRQMKQSLIGGTVVKPKAEPKVELYEQLEKQRAAEDIFREATELGRKSLEAENRNALQKTLLSSDRPMAAVSIPGALPEQDETIPMLLLSLVAIAGCLLFAKK